MNVKYAGIVLIMVVIAALFFFSLQESKIGIFPEELGDMQIIEVGEGNMSRNEAIYAIIHILPLTDRYYAMYQSNNETMQIWVAEFDSHELAYETFEEIKNIKTQQELRVPGIKVPVVYVSLVDGRLQYHYLKKNRIFVFSFENDSVDYHMELIKEGMVNV